jgi:hypothetical protein
MPLPAYEKLGSFYLGRAFDPARDALGEDVLYDSRDLTTHAVCIGMTGSGKTGLCISLLEEAAIDGIPALVIDPKGDIANLALTFPQLRPEDFEPWVDAGEAARKGKSVAEFAAGTAETWRKGLAEWGQDGARIERLRAAAPVTIYTPGSRAGRPLSILRSFSAPDPVVAKDAAAVRDRASAAVAGLLGLLGVDADPIRSREFILLSALLDAAWRKGESLDLAALIRSVQKPPFDKVGVFDLESFFPAKDRTDLALRINGLLASPGFEAWLDGDALDIQSLLHDGQGKPCVAIVSIAHLNDAERMFVVTLIANELVAWMRRQPGTTSLRALFYMDEVFGYFPPGAMPPSKTPLLTLMKQARAFGLGVVLATQNPVDLDYKGLGNAGTWFIGRLQTERDKARVIEGLLGSDAASGLDKSQFEAAMSSLPPRTFLMRNVHDDAPVLLRTRWAMSYLRGPLTTAEIARLQPDAPGTTSGDVAAATATATQSSTPLDAPGAGNSETTSRARPVLPADVLERFLAARGTSVEYRACFGARVRSHFVDAKAELDAWTDAYHLAPYGPRGPSWDEAEVCAIGALELLEEPAPGAGFASLAASLVSAKAQQQQARALVDAVYRTSAMTLYRCPPLKLTSTPGESEGEFRARLALHLRERRDAAVDALRRKYSTRIDAAADRARRAEQKLEREREQASSETMSTALRVGGSLLGALFGGGRARSGAIGKAATAARSVGRAGKERSDVTHAEADLEALRAQAAALEADLEREVAGLQAAHDPATLAVETVDVRPRKSDIEVSEVALVWRPA